MVARRHKSEATACAEPTCGPNPRTSEWRSADPRRSDAVLANPARPPPPALADDHPIPGAAHRRLPLDGAVPYQEIKRRTDVVGYPTRRRCCGWPGRCWSKPTTNGRSATAATSPKPPWPCSPPPPRRWHQPNSCRHSLPTLTRTTAALTPRRGTSPPTRIGWHVVDACSSGAPGILLESCRRTAGHSAVGPLGQLAPNVAWSHQQGISPYPKRCYAKNLRMVLVAAPGVTTP
jgi:hypothetical protein